MGAVTTTVLANSINKIPVSGKLSRISLNLMPSAIQSLICSHFTNHEMVISLAHVNKSLYHLVSIKKLDFCQPLKIQLEMRKKIEIDEINKYHERYKIPYQKIFETCPSITDLNLRDGMNRTDIPRFNYFQLIIENFPNLKKLTLPRGIPLCADKFVELVERASQLDSLDLANCLIIGEQDPVTPFIKTRSIVELDLSYRDIMGNPFGMGFGYTYNLEIAKKIANRNIERAILALETKTPTGLQRLGLQYWAPESDKSIPRLQIVLSNSPNL